MIYARTCSLGTGFDLGRGIDVSAIGTDLEGDQVCCEDFANGSRLHALDGKVNDG
jgi:hypothetical protein